MFFTYLGRIVLALVVELFRLSIATGVLGPYDAALARYTTATTSGQVIDKGIYIILIAIAFGILT